MFELSCDATTTEDVRTGLIVELSLRPGQYATVAMREFMQGSPDNEVSPD